MNITVQLQWCSVNSTKYPDIWIL